MIWQVPITIATASNKEALKFVLDKSSATITLEGISAADWIKVGVVYIIIIIVHVT